MAETFLVPHHPAARDLQALQYTQDRNKFREQHRVLFRFVYGNLPEWCCVFKSNAETKLTIYCSSCSVLGLFWIPCFGLKIANGWVSRPNVVWLNCKKRVLKRACCFTLEIVWIRWNFKDGTCTVIKHNGFPLMLCYLCSYCKRIRTTNLTLDGLRLKRQKKFVDKNEEARLIRRFYYTTTRRRLEFM